MFSEFRTWWRRQVWPVATKEFIHLINDATTLRIAIMLPVIQLIIFGFAINMDVSNIPTAILNEDLRPASYELVDAFKNTTYFHINEVVYSKDALLKAIRKGDVKVGVDIPPDYSDNILNGQKASFQVLIDGSDSNTASQGLSTSVQLGTVLSQKLQDDKGLQDESRDQNKIEAAPHLLYNPDLKTTFLIIPALLAIVLMMVILMLTTFSIVKEKEQGTMDQLLVTPLRPAGLIVGKILPYIGLGLLDFNFVLLVMRVVFQVPIRGSVPMLEVCALIFIMSVLGMGLIISSFATNQAQAGQIAQMTALPTILLSGYIFQIQTEPPPIQVISYLLPATYFINILRGVIVRGASIQEMFRPLLIMTLLSIFILGVSIAAFKKRAA